MTDVLFGQGYYLRFDPKLWAAHQPYPPLGALYAASSARAAGYDVALFDAMLADSEHEWTDAVERHRPRFAVIYEDSFNYLSKMCLTRMRDAALTMVTAARRGGARVIVAGSDASDQPALYLDAGAEIVIAGEGEATLVEVLHSLSGTQPRLLENIAGICFRNTDATTARTRRREVLRDLDALPRPAWELVDVERYRAIWLRHHGRFSMNLSTTRGCPYHCNWCAKPIYGQRYAARSVESVVDEIAWLKATYRPDHLWIVDDIFGLKPGWIERFAGLVAERSAVVPFKCLLRADGVTEAVAAALEKAGCRTAWIGAESGSQRILDAMEKGTSVDQIRTAARRLKAHHIEVGFFLQFGYPGETLEDIELTLQMVRDCTPDDIGISVSYPLPGTPFYDRVKAQLGAKQNWVDSDDLAMMYRGTFHPDFYRALHHVVHAEFRSRQAGEVIRGARPFGGRWRHLASGLWQAARLPILRRQLAVLARQPVAGDLPALIPVLTRQAAAIPTEPS